MKMSQKKKTLSTLEASNLVLHKFDKLSKHWTSKQTKVYLWKYSKYIFVCLSTPSCVLGV